MLDIDILRDHGVQSTLTQSSETSRTMFIAVFNDIGDIHMINSVCRKHKYHQILQRRALMSGKRLCGKWFININKKSSGWPGAKTSYRMQLFPVIE